MKFYNYKTIKFFVFCVWFFIKNNANTVVGLNNFNTHLNISNTRCDSKKIKYLANNDTLIKNNDILSFNNSHENKYTTINDRNNVLNNVTTTSVNSYSSNLLNSEDLLIMIANQTESIKNEICSSCLEINSSLDILIHRVRIIKKYLEKYHMPNPDESVNNSISETRKTINNGNSNYSNNSSISYSNLRIKKTSTNNINIREIYSVILNSINNLNLIRADLFKLNEILETLKKTNCKNYTDNLNKYLMVQNSTNKIVEFIQEILLNFNININLVVLN